MGKYVYSAYQTDPVSFPCIDQNNNPVDSFEGDGELVWQGLCVGEWEDIFTDAAEWFNRFPNPDSDIKATRQVWKVLIEVTEERETVGQAARKYPKGGVEEAAFYNILNALSEVPDTWDDIIPNYVQGAKFGAKYTSSKSIDRAKAIEAINGMKGKVSQNVDYTNGWNDSLEELLIVLKTL